MISNFEMFRTDVNHIGSSPLRDMNNLNGKKTESVGKSEKSAFYNIYTIKKPPFTFLVKRRSFFIL